MRSLGGLGEERKLKEQEEEVEAQRICGGEPDGDGDSLNMTRARSHRSVGVMLPNGYRTFSQSRQKPKEKPKLRLTSSKTEAPFKELSQYTPTPQKAKV